MVKEYKHRMQHSANTSTSLSTKLPLSSSWIFSLNRFFTQVRMMIVGLNYEIRKWLEANENKGNYNTIEKSTCSKSLLSAKQLAEILIQLDIYQQLSLICLRSSSTSPAQVSSFPASSLLVMSGENLSSTKVICNPLFGLSSFFFHKPSTSVQFSSTIVACIVWWKFIFYQSNM